MQMQSTFKLVGQTPCVFVVLCFIFPALPIFLGKKPWERGCLAQCIRAPKTSGKLVIVRRCSATSKGIVYSFFPFVRACASLSSGIAYYHQEKMK